MKNSQVSDNSMSIIINNKPIFYDEMCSIYRSKDSITTEHLTGKQTAQLEILHLLEQLGFPMNETGTYFYKNIILEASKKLLEVTSKEDEEALEQEMSNSFSQFYFNLSRNDHDIGVKTFHSCVIASFLNRNQKEENMYLKHTIGLDDNAMDYRKQALTIAKYYIKAKENGVEFIAFISPKQNYENVYKKMKVRT